MKSLLILLAAAPAVFLLPWLAPLWHRRYLAAGLWFAAWAAALLVALLLWFGPGLLALLALGLAATLCHTVPLRRGPDSSQGPAA